MPRRREGVIAVGDVLDRIHRQQTGVIAAGGRRVVAGFRRVAVLCAGAGLKREAQEPTSARGLRARSAQRHGHGARLSCIKCGLGHASA
jgi:hypothetical protein